MDAIFASGFNRENLKVARQAIEKALSSVNLGLELKLGNITYTGDSFTCKVECAMPGQAERKDEKEQQLLKSMAAMFGFDVAREPFISGRGVCKLMSYNSRARKSPWIVKHGDGRMYKYTTEEVARHWSGQ